MRAARKRDYYWSITLPSLIVASYGGGTGPADAARVPGNDRVLRHWQGDKFAGDRGRRRAGSDISLAARCSRRMGDVARAHGPQSALKGADGHLRHGWNGYACWESSLAARPPRQRAPAANTRSASSRPAPGCSPEGLWESDADLGSVPRAPAWGRNLDHARVVDAFTAASNSGSFQTADSSASRIEFW